MKAKQVHIEESSIEIIRTFQRDMDAAQLDVRELELTTRVALCIWCIINLRNFCSL